MHTNANFYSISPYKYKQNFKKQYLKYGHNIPQTVSCFFLGEVIFGGVHSDLLWGLGPSNHIHMERFHSFSASVVTKGEPVFQSNKSLDTNSEGIIPLMYICWLLSSFAVKILKKTQWAMPECT